MTMVIFSLQSHSQYFIIHYYRSTAKCWEWPRDDGGEFPNLFATQNPTDAQTQTHIAIPSLCLISTYKYSQSS